MECIKIKTYKTAEVAKIMGVHPNTVRLYEELGLIPKTKREANGYRIFTDFHIAVFRLAKTAFQIEVLQNGLRKKIVEVVKVTAAGEFDKALLLTDEYLLQVREEQENAGEAIAIVKQLISCEFGEVDATEDLELKRKEAAEYLQISTDTLRNWEMNGLLKVKRKANGYRVYTGEDINRLKIIRSLRCANYSLEAILRMLNRLSCDPGADIEETLDTPKPDDDIISVQDKLITSLKAAEQNAVGIKNMLLELQAKGGPVY